MLMYTAIFVCGLVAAGQAMDCNMGDAVGCMQPMQQIQGQLPQGGAPTQEQKTKFCPTINTAITCIKSVVDACNAQGKSPPGPAAQDMTGFKAICGSGAKPSGGDGSAEPEGSKGGDDNGSGLSKVSILLMLCALVFTKYFN